MEINTSISTNTEVVRQSQAPSPKIGETESKDSAPTTQEITKQISEQKDEAELKKLKDELRKLTEELNREINPLNTSIRFGFNDQIDSLTVNVIDTTNDRVIRKIPSDEAIKLMQKMREIVGIIFDKQG